MAATTKRDTRPPAGQHAAGRHVSALLACDPLVSGPTAALTWTVGSGALTAHAVGPIPLQQAIAAAGDVAAVAKAAAGLPALFLDLVEAGLRAPEVSKSLTLLHDAVTRRLLVLAQEEYGRPPVDFAWLALGSAARRELTLSSDQDNGLVYAGDTDPVAEAQLARIAAYVTSGLAACGFKADGSGVSAADARWRLPLEAWTDRLTRCFSVPNESHIVGASIAFDCGKVAGDLPVAGALAAVVRAAPRHPAFLAGIGATAREVQSPLRFPRRLTGHIDLKRSGLLAIANLARYLALTHGLTMTGTLDRLAAVERLGLGDEESMRSLQSSFVLIADVRMRHQAGQVRAGKRPDNVVDTDDLPRIVRAGVREALRIVAESQRLLPPALHGWA